MNRMTCLRAAIIVSLVLLELRFTPTARADFVLIDDFNSYALGELNGQSDGTGTWETTDDNFVIEVDPTDADNRVLNVLRVLASGAPSAQLSDDPNLSIADGTTATLFFRFYRGDVPSSMNWGLTDLLFPSQWNDFEVQLRNDFGDTFDVKGDLAGGGFKDIVNVEPVPADEWIHCWVVIDQADDTYEGYFRSERTYPTLTKFETDLDTITGDPTVFGLVNGTDDPLETFWIRSCCGEGSIYGDHTDPWYIDDIYVDLDGENLNSPLLDTVRLQAGDADMDLDFDQLDLVQVQIAAKYLSGADATWGEGDWDGAPGGEPGSPPAGNGKFDQLDIIAALAAGHYLTGPYGAIKPGGEDGQASIIYNAATGELAVDVAAGVALTSVNVDSAASILTGESAQNLGGSFDNDADSNLFKATFGDSFGSLSFGNVAQTGLAEEFVRQDLTVLGSLAGGGSLDNVDLIYVPEPASALLLVLGLAFGLAYLRRRSR